MKKYIIGLTVLGVLFTESTFAQDNNFFYKHTEWNDKNTITAYFNAPNSTFNTFQYDVPEWGCMNKDGLPKIDMYIQEGMNERSLTLSSIKESTNNDWYHNQFGTITHTFEFLDPNGKIVKFPFDSNISPFSYSTDNGNTWHEYRGISDANLPNGCSITNFRIVDFRGKIQSNSNPETGELVSSTNIVYSYKVNVVNTKKDRVSDSMTYLDANGDKIGEKTKILFKNQEIADQFGRKCENAKINVNITEEKKTTTSTTTTTPPKEDPKPSTPTTSGPGGGSSSVVTTTTTITPPPSTPTPTPASVPVPTPTPVIVEEKKETPSFSMDFVEVVTQKLPSILPKMGAFTGSSRSGNGMVRDNHGILRSAKDIIKLLDTKINSRDFRLAGSTNTELSHWLQVLDKNEQNLDKYVVIPSIGLVMPIADVKKTDKAYKNFLSGKTEHFYDYAGKGAVGIPDVGNKFGENGNKIIAGHSSWWKTDTSVKYKTHFQKIINLKAGTEIWVYEKNTKTGEYTRHVYQAEESYNTSETDVSILKQTKDSTLTLFTCTPIGGDIGRWVVKAKLVK